MVAVLTAALMSAAEISNLCSALGVIICFVCMVVFILRLQGEDFIGTSVTHVAHPPVAQVAVQKVIVPFFMEIHQPTSSSYSDIQMRVHSEVPYLQRIFWGVPSDKLHSLINGSWPTFLQFVIEEPAIKADVTEDCIREETANVKENIKHFQFQGDPKIMMLGLPPRKKYPLVVCIVRQEVNEGTDPSSVAALISIIHIKDSECQVPTCILHQYLKQYSGQLTRLKALYTQSNYTNNSEEHTTIHSETVNSDMKDRISDSCDTAEGKETIEEDEDIPLEEACVVCQVKQTTRALLPCRHVCVCSTCCSRLSTCPMCRARILSYFLVAPESVEDSDSEIEIQDPPTMWQRVCNVITDMMPGEM